MLRLFFPPRVTIINCQLKHIAKAISSQKLHNTTKISCFLHKQKICHRKYHLGVPVPSVYLGDPVKINMYKQYQQKMQANSQRLPDVVTKSLNDPKNYRVIQLQNGLTALLIEDKDTADVQNTAKSGSGDDKKPAEKLAAAALCVGIGSFSDPPDLPGLAHFLEHMVFMGSEKYPNENEFDEFTKKHGGYNNAFTECEHTVFYFNVEKTALQKALDIFSGFFSSPLMKQDSVDRELKAVDSEFCMSKPSDSVRWEQLVASMAKEGHPMGKFMWGNMESLKLTPEKQGIDSYERLRQFHLSSYSAQFMTLVVQAMYPLDKLEEWVTDIFSSVVNNNLERPSFQENIEPFNTPQYNKIYKVIPCKNENKLTISWSLPTQLQHYQSKPLSYLGFLIGHEGTGSIMAALRKRMWAVDLEGGNGETGYEHNSTHAAFTVSIKLTESGLEQIHDVITLVLQYVDMLRREGPKKWIYDEIKDIHDNDFRWIEADDPVENVENLVSNMLIYSPTDYITGEKLYFKYDPEPITQCLALMTPQKANFYISSKKFASENICNLKEKWYKTQYCVQDVPEELQQKWRNLEIVPELHLPSANPYIASDFTVKTAENHTEYPVAITDTELSRLFYKQDTKFKSPKAYVSFLMISPAIKKSAQSLLMFDLFIDMLQYQLMETAYAASVASLSFNFLRKKHGLQIKVVGFNDKLLKLFQTLVDFIASFSVDTTLLATMKKKTQKDLYNSVLKPSKLNKELRLAILCQNEATSIDGMRMLSSITADMMIAFVKEMTSVVFVEGLVQGNLTAQEAKTYESYLLEKLNCKAIPGKEIPETRVIEVEVGHTYTRTDNLNKNDENSVITNYYQHGSATLHQFSLNDLLTMRMEEPCFAILRTQHQLGYGVGCNSCVTDGILGLSITVHSQAHKFSLEQLDQYMENFLTEFDKILQADTDQDFDTMKSSLITLKNCVDSNLGEEFMRNWAEIIDRTYSFDTLKKQVAELQNITLAELRDWYSTYLTSGGRCRKLSVQVEGHKSAAKATEEESEDLEEDALEDEGEESMEEEDEDEEEDVEMTEDFNVEELNLKVIEGKPSDSVITSITDLQIKSKIFPVSRIS